MALTQEQIQQMIAGLQGTSPEQLSQMGGMYRDPVTGMGIHANYGAGRYDPATGDYVAGAPTEYMVSAPGATREASSPFDRYSTAGQYIGTGNYAPATNIEKQLLKYGLALAGTAAAGGAFGNMFGGAGGVGGATNPAAAGGFNAAVDSQLANAALGSEALAGYTGAAGVTPSLGGVGGAVGGAGASGGGGLLSSIIPKDLMGLAGVVGPAIGGLLGSKPQETSQTSTRSIDPRFENAIFGQGGLLGMVQNNLNAKRPQSALSNITPRGNGFKLFTGR